MDVKIGFADSTRELEIEMADDLTQAKLVESLNAAASASKLFWITDKKGRQVGVAGTKISYIVVGAPREERRVGFGA